MVVLCQIWPTPVAISCPHIGWGTPVAYAASHREVALEGEGDNSPFATVLMRQIAMPGIEINKLFRLVHDVSAAPAPTTSRERVNCSTFR